MKLKYLAMCWMNVVTHAKRDTHWCRFELFSSQISVRVQQSSRGDTNRVKPSGYRLWQFTLNTVSLSMSFRKFTVATAIICLVLSFAFMQNAKYLMVRGSQMGELGLLS